MHWSDTIAALATPSGRSGIAVVRLSGPRSLEIATGLARVESSQLVSHCAKLVALYDQQQLLDRVVMIWMRAPRSFTGEEVVEIQCHGSMLIVRKILDACYAAGARPATPGEFSLRAFKNQKIDLAQAEAIQQLIHASSERALQAAQSHLEGHLSKLIGRFQKELTLQAAILEAWVDFPEEDLEFATFEELHDRIAAVQAQIARLLATYHEGQLISEGLRLCLLGRPNVGKSSLMNALLRKERSIVTEIAGTTRDVIEEAATLCGFYIRLIDTAGVRDTEERIEQEGIRRTWQKVDEADLVLWILDASCGCTAEDWAIGEQVPREKTILVWNKCDLPHPALPHLGMKHVVGISAAQGEGLDQLQELIGATIGHTASSGGEELLLTNLRHKLALERADSALTRVRVGLKEHRLAELVCSDMREALKALAELVGGDVTEELISAIFSTFCLGK